MSSVASTPGKFRTAPVVLSAGTEILLVGQERVRAAGERALPGVELVGAVEGLQAGAAGHDGNIEVDAGRLHLLLLDIRHVGSVSNERGGAEDPDGDAVGKAGLGEQLLRLGGVVADTVLERFAVGEPGWRHRHQRIAARHARPDDGFGEHRPVDRHVDRLAHLLVVGRRQAQMQRDFIVGGARLDGDAQARIGRQHGPVLRIDIKTVIDLPGQQGADQRGRVEDGCR